MSPAFGPARLRDVFRCLHEVYGPQSWWPAETPFEVMIGAVLTQNTSWANVQRALDNLKRSGRFSLPGMQSLPEPELARLIQPAGYFNVKARRLRHLLRFVEDLGGEEAMRSLPTESLRERLLGVHGIGPETADDILLYAFHRPVFVIDAYTRRLFSRLGMIGGGEDYDELRGAVESHLGGDAGVFNEFHALIVRHAKESCRKRPLCDGCGLRRDCPRGGLEAGSGSGAR